MKKFQAELKAHGTGNDGPVKKPKDAENQQFLENPKQLRNWSFVGQQDAYSKF